MSLAAKKTRPQAPYRALDLTNDRGYLCGKLLADLGADVVKIESPGGDAARNQGPFYHGIPHPEKSLYWFAVNAGKRGITLDIKSATGKEILRRLVEEADFFIESFDPGYLDKLGMGYRELSQLNPRLVYTSIRLFGDSGPYRDYAGTDFTLMTSGSLIYTTGDADRPPACINAPQAFFHAGAQAVAGTMIAHYSRQMTGRGQQITVSAQASVSTFTPFFRYLWEFLGQVAPRDSRIRLGHGVYFRTIWPCKDGYIAFRIFTGATTHTKRMYPLMQCLKDHNAAGDLPDVVWEKKDTMTLGQAETDHWHDVIGRFFLQYTKAEIFGMAQRYKFMFLLPVSNPADILKDPQLAARNYFVKLEHPELEESISYPGAFYESTASAVGPTRRPPLIGEHNLEVYGELGFSKEQLAGLKQARII